MVGKAGLKAGLIGAGIMVILSLLGLIPIPFLGCVCLCVAWLGFAGAGVLAARFLDETATSGDGAKAGAIAGVVSGLGYGIVSSIVAVIQGSAGAIGGASALMDPEMLRQFEDMGVDPSIITGMASTTGVGIAALCCCLGSLAIGAGLGALGGIIYMSIARKD